ncbi:hypothetical protein BAUCODRAFT_408168 [Baudoinia panamericana UAMH 10762]|uniref:Uncharacterized protein n=1 Tax=Baudoinia panamericana (strain UAMH 10762) TaxID=717646 RepID=M2MMK4_BAUPA|nr:uncharacterized protein BAUCODRAFT_408168 [Baudoinia panamericana UAMH 10762]EMC97926.1 hypothetical protein BAUCODRAFT_408168 [Baudoinia panamericana UAMH 10762]
MADAPRAFSDATSDRCRADCVRHQLPESFSVPANPKLLAFRHGQPRQGDRMATVTRRAGSGRMYTVHLGGQEHQGAFGTMREFRARKYAVFHGDAMSVQRSSNKRALL